MSSERSAAPPAATRPPTLDDLRRRREEILAVAAAHGASSVRVFGSVARGKADEANDVDFLVDMERGRTLFDHTALCLAMEELLGQKVDVATVSGLKPRIRDRVLREAVKL